MRSLLLFFILGNIAFSAECESSFYKIKEGDSLTTISQKIYGNSTLWSIIFEQNRDKIQNPYNIVAGEVIKIPCIDDRKPQKSVEKKAIPKKAIPEKVERVTNINIVSTTTLHPFMENSTSHKNMLTDIVKEVLDGLKVNYSIEYIENRAIHSTLLEKGKYDISIGWYRPNFRQEDSDFIYSKPLFQTITALYRRKGDNREISSAKDIEGAKICRPKGWFSFDLEKQGLIDNIVTKSRAERCFSSLKDGKVDFVSLTSFVGDAIMNKMGLSRYIESVKSISTIIDLTVVSHKNNPKGRLYINKFNQGLEKLNRSGKLEAIQSKYLKEFYNNMKD